MKSTKKAFSASPRSLCFAISILFLNSPNTHAKSNPLNEPITPLRMPDQAEDSEKVLLGQKLFEDKILSQNQTVSCSSCHNLNHGGSDGLASSIGINGAIGTINSPTVFNSGLNFRQFWNGRAKSLEDQIDGPIEHPKEMGTKWSDVVSRLTADKKYSGHFSKIYKNGITKENIKDALAVFERTLVTLNSRFDLYLNGNSESLTLLEKKGYQKFKAFGCISCHQGVNVGGNMFQTMGIMGDYFKDRGTPVTEADLGRFTVTKNELDKYVFRVPSLRNIELTPPYFHDGSAKTLEEAVGVMAKYQLGRKMPKEDLDAIVAFLKTLTGEAPKSIRLGSKDSL